MTAIEVCAIGHPDAPGLTRLASALDARFAEPAELTRELSRLTRPPLAVVVAEPALATLPLAVLLRPTRLGLWLDPSRVGSPTPLLRAALAVVDAVFLDSAAAEVEAVRLGADPERLSVGPSTQWLADPPRPRRRALLEAALSLCLDGADRVGILAALERRTRRVTNVLNYHRILPVDEQRRYPRPEMAVSAPLFEVQLDQLEASTGFVPVAEVRAEHAAGKVAITFDDGYEDNARVAGPILRAHGAPACVFLATRLVGEADPLWWDRVGHFLLEWWAGATGRSSDPGALAIARSPLPPLPPPIADLGEATSLAEARDVTTRVLSAMNGLEEETRAALTAEVDRRLRGRRPGRTMLTWDEVRALGEQGFTFGSHTRDHVILAELDPAEAREQLFGAQADLERELGAPSTYPRLCALPRGVKGPVDEHELARRFDAVMTTEVETNRPGAASVYVHRRDGRYLTLGGRHHPAKLRLELTGLLDPIRGLVERKRRLSGRG